MISLAERLWTRVDFEGPISVRRPDLGPCWVWLGRKYKGYGRLTVEGAGRPVHRLAYVMCVGPIPDGYEVDHLCFNTSCCNPSHLEAVTHEINVLRSSWGDKLMRQKARATCPQGHAYSESNVYRLGSRRYCRECRHQRAPARIAKLMLLKATAR